MSYIDDFVAQNAGTMTRDQLAASLRAAGYDKREINTALRRSGSRATLASPGQRADPALAYLRQHREQFPREALRHQLEMAGHGDATIDAAFQANDDELREGTRRLEGLVKPAFWALAGIIAAFQVLPGPIAVILVAAVLIAGVLIWLRRRGRI